MLRISLQLDTLCTSAVRRYCAISGISPFTYRLFSRVRLSDFMEAEKLATKYSWTSVSLMSYSAKPCNTNCIDNFRDVDHLKRVLFCCTAGSDKPGRNKTGAKPISKRC